jgi:hypothetical protein
MPLIVEDGTGKADADSWISEADANAYWTDRATAWPTDLDQAEGALRQAADYLTIAYRWPGQPTLTTQRLPWPRAGVLSGRGYFPSDSIPTQIIQAQLVLALEAIDKPLLKRADVSAERAIIEETKALKGITKTLKYAAPEVDSLSGLRRYPVIDRLLAGIAISGTATGFASVPLRRTL